MSLQEDLRYIFPERNCKDPAMQKQFSYIHGLALDLLAKLRTLSASSGYKNLERKTDKLIEKKLNSLKLAQAKLTDMMPDPQTAKTQAVDNRMQLARIYLRAGDRREATMHLNAMRLFMLDPDTKFPYYSHHFKQVNDALLGVNAES